MTVPMIGVVASGHQEADNYQALVLSDSPLAYWPLQETSGTVGEDIVGTNDLNLTGATFGASGPSGQTAVIFDGTNDHAASSAAVDLSPYPRCSFEMWLYWDAWADDGDFLLAHGTEANLSVFHQPNRSSGFFFAGHGPDYNARSYNRWSAAAWHHLAIVHDLSLVSTDEVKLYLDGAFVTSADFPNIAGNTGNFNSHTLRLMVNSAGTGNFGAGRLAHVAVYPVALTAARVSAHYGAAF